MNSSILFEEGTSGVHKMARFCILITVLVYKNGALLTVESEREECVPGRGSRRAAAGSAVTNPFNFMQVFYFVTCHYRTPSVNMTDGSCTLNAGSPRCSKHGRFCALRVVKKDGENKGRQFYACPLPREARCDYFEVCEIAQPWQPP